ncbi:AHH domain-containing protein [Thalassomonas sp. RHCl1]|uniref:AHH domain-containing protein n=1 Tax=Thalassomonas sp. RHCl1 TaxID=2995320 RepID=UPI00248AF646|nr:AHH domain-containing protein [Thalassomonas sp. RHCl1]
MEVNEASADAVTSDNHDKDCYFCNAKESPTTETNDLIDEPDEDAAEMEDSLGEYKFKNRSGKLGRALGGKPEPRKVILAGKPYDAAVAAHHLIPGNASLKESAIMEWLHVDGKAVGNIGYNVNAKTNGVWSPGNYGVRPWGTKGAAFVAECAKHCKDSGYTGEPITAKDFAFSAMEAWGCQFHDAHEDYSTFVADVLDKIADKLDNNKNIWCPEQKKKNKDEPTQMFQIVGRLNTVSARMKKMLTFPTFSWKSNVWTSAFAQSYMLEKEHQSDK